MAGSRSRSCPRLRLSPHPSSAPRIQADSATRYPASIHDPQGQPIVGRPSLSGPAEQEELAWMMIERVGVHRPDQAYIVGYLAQVRQKIGYLGTRLPAGRELLWGSAEHRRCFGLMKASCRSFVIEDGSGLRRSTWPAPAWDRTESSWLGPPSMNMKITFLALGGEHRSAGSGCSGLVSRARYSRRNRRC